MISQAGIALFGVAAIFLTQHIDIRWRRWASLVGLAGQPFWFAAAFDAHQWGILAVNCLYTLAWAKGFRDNLWPHIRIRHFGRRP